ncbi:MAG TPA: diaminopimelate epimerase [Candidatus Latescibacteria bacterium]|jgi:diaminopimelate epimerase|nr:diaminopimelate epimerase [Gemmatimonadaceae bacterium]MDP6017590.1 diaminopimelate epimerase [Candidatus Latescibacterota bacterium]HJP32334.1 diaminopimelate epimerase [Candidatus Latescibacterota bacterium]
MINGFFKGHGLGNDYIALDPADLEFRLTEKRIRAICDRHRGAGSDGILALVPSKKADFGVRIYNPDGSEAEKSGNGLRIFARYLYSTRRTRKKRFTVETKGGLVAIDLHIDSHGDASSATVEMGQATFRPQALPCSLSAAELIERPIKAAGRSLSFTGVSVGNPHCVVFREPGQSWTREELLELGPQLENHRIFPRRTNVQLAVPVGPKSLYILIWERGAGETQASGSSSCAAAAAAVRLGLVQSPVTVKAPGGNLHIDVRGEAFELTMKGPVSEVFSGRLTPAFVREIR